MKRRISNVLIIVSVLLLILPTWESQKEVEFTEDLIKEVEEVIELGGSESILEIDKIDLRLPIKHGATHENMKYSVATMTHEEVLEGHNFTIAGHRNLRRGKNFNRLDELSNGDLIRVKGGPEDKVFKVNDKKIVTPEEVSILDDNGKTEITMITCYPIGVSTHRLVIKGEIVDEKEN